MRCRNLNQHVHKLYLVYKHSICMLCGQSRRNIEKQLTTSYITRLTVFAKGKL